LFSFFISLFLYFLRRNLSTVFINDAVATPYRRSVWESQKSWNRRDNGKWFISVRSFWWKMHFHVIPQTWNKQTMSIPWNILLIVLAKYLWRLHAAVIFHLKMTKFSFICKATNLKKKTLQDKQSLNGWDCDANDG
jgi:hypothetical protein